MKILFQLLGIFIVVAGISLLVYPALIYDWIMVNLESRILYFAAFAVRLILGGTLIWTAPRTRFPNIIRCLGVISIVAALGFMFLGQAGFIDILSSGLPLMKPYGWISGLVSIVVGGFLIIAYSDKKIGGRE